MKEEKAIFAGGCFWCTQKTFDSTQGVLDTHVGYTGGKVKNPSYEDVCSGTTGHVEAIEVIYDSDIVSYEKLLEVFWESIDPKNFKGQYCDIGTQYMPVIFYINDQQKNAAQIAKSKKEELLGQVSVKLEPSKDFYRAQDYHQKYYKKNPQIYLAYVKGSGRSQ